MTDESHQTPVEPPPPEPTADGETWMRLHPGTILDDAVQRIPNVVIGLFLILTSSAGDATEVIQLAIGVLAIAPVVVRYLTGRYRLDSELVQWRVGLITNRHTDLPRHRIQSVDTRITVVGRLLGLETVVISSAGDEGEIRIGLVDSTTADWIRSEVTPETAPPPTSNSVAPGDHAPPDAGASDEVLAELGAADLARVILVQPGRLVVLSGLVFTAAATIAGLASGLIGIGSIVFAVPLLLSAFGLARGVVTEAVGFSSHLRGDRVRVSRGLVARSSLTSPLARVQGMTIKRTIPARWFGTERVSIDTADATADASNNQGTTQTLVHPLAPKGTWRVWAETLLRSSPPSRGRVQRVAPVSLRRRLLAAARLALALWLVFTIVVWLLSQAVDSDIPMWIAVGLGIALPLIAGATDALGYKNERWALGEEQVGFRGGALSTTVVVIPRVRTQGAMIRANWFQRRLGVANIVVDTASPTVGGTGRDLHLGDAQDVAMAVLASADRDGGV